MFETTQGMVNRSALNTVLARVPASIAAAFEDVPELPRDDPGWRVVDIDGR